MRVLMIGDVVGRPGRSTVKALLPELRSSLKLDLVILQGENLAGGFGLTCDTVQEMLHAGVDVITTGNHVWDQRSFISQLDDADLPVLRPMNYPDTAPGRGIIDVGEAVVVNLIGRVFVGEFDSPFQAARRVAEAVPVQDKPVFVDFHAEATSEKQALGWYLDGWVSAVAGTHTHVPTADARVLPKGTGFVADLGMVGASDSVLGMEVKGALRRFLHNMPQRLKVASGPRRFNSVLFDIEEATGLTRAIERVDRYLDQGSLSPVGGQEDDGFSKREKRR